MPSYAITQEERQAIAVGIATETLAPDFVDWESLTADDARDILARTRYEIQFNRVSERRRLHGAPQRRAQKLLRSLLNQNQLQTLKVRGYFFVRGSEGGLYRLNPRFGGACRVEKHGTRYFAVERYCLHDPDNVMPPADVTIGHLLLLRADEPEFLRLANATATLDQLWNGDYLRRLREARIRRAREKDGEDRRDLRPEAAREEHGGGHAPS
jgi:hypothetical protein